MEEPTATKYLEPYLEIERRAGVASRVEEAEGHAAVNAAAEEDGDLESPPGHRAGQVRFEVAGSGGGGRRVQPTRNRNGLRQRSSAPGSTSSRRGPDETPGNLREPPEEI